MLLCMGLRDFLKKRELKRLGEDRFILCLDGGGMRGVIPATILEHVGQLLRTLGDDRPLYSHFDLISGTSTGGLIALALTAPRREGSLLAIGQQPLDTPEEPKVKRGKQVVYRDPGPDIRQITDIYLKYGRIIFPRSQSLFNLGKINQLFTQKYDDLSFNQLLMDIFGDIAIGEALTPTMVVTYDYAEDMPYIISSYGTPKIMVRTAARATSAAPTYFSPTLVHDPRAERTISLIDGGVVANNPVLYAYKEAKRLYPEAKRFHVLSISTASAPYKLDAEQAGGGVIGWLDPARGTPIYRLYASSQMRTSHEIASAIGDLEYVRIHGDLKRKVKLDETDPVVLAQMIDSAEHIYQEHAQRIEEFCRRFLERPDHPQRPKEMP